MKMPLLTKCSNGVRFFLGQTLPISANIGRKEKRYNSALVKKDHTLFGRSVKWAVMLFPLFLYLIDEAGFETAIFNFGDRFSAIPRCLRGPLKGLVMKFSMRIIF